MPIATTAFFSLMLGDLGSALLFDRRHLLLRKERSYRFARIK